MTMPTAVRRAAWAEWAAWTCKERQRSLLPDAQRLVDRETPGGKLPGVFCGRESVSIYPHLKRGRDSPSYASHMSREVRGTLHPHRHSAIYSPEGKFKCLRRILLCAWSTRQRICFLTRRASRSASSRATSDRCIAVRAFHSRTGSSSFAIKDSGTSAFVDSLTSKLRHRSHPRRCAAATSPRQVLG